ncbi:MAG TPA: prolyl oligopeptidase family serine peptidase [Steroidobacteraceae bacterium]
MGALIASGIGVCAGAGAGAAVAGVAEHPALDAKVYDRAAQFLASNQEKLVLNAEFAPHWRRGAKERFTYRRELGDGRADFVEVWAATGKRTAAFDQTIVAAGLSKVLGKAVEAQRLPFKDYEETAVERISFSADGKHWNCSTRSADCAETSPPATDPAAVASPDGRWLAFVDNGNLWIRSADGTTRFPLTTDAMPHYGYAASVESTAGVMFSGAAARALAVKDGHALPGPPGPPPKPVLLWSPDSKYLFTHRLDERSVRDITLVQSTPTDGSLRPVANQWRYAMPNDSAVPEEQPWLFDLTNRTGRAVGAAAPAVFFTPIQAGDAWWSGDSARLYLIARSRYAKSMSLNIVDAVDGTSRQLLSETGKTFVESASLAECPMVYVLSNRDVLWFSERDGFGRLYLYDGSTGRLKRPLTEGAWTVRNVLHLDEAHGFIYVAANEREPGVDPYYRIVYRIGLNDGRVRRLTPEIADHAVASEQETGVLAKMTGAAGNPQDTFGFSPSGRFFLDTYTRTDLPPVTVLRRSDGTLVAEIERADVSKLMATGLKVPERFSAPAADGKTMLFGNLLRPSNFDPNKHYPVLDSPYPGPQSHRAQPNFLAAVFDRFGAQAYAELGFIVVVVDGRGSHGRSKRFHDESYGGLAQAGHLDDHVAVLRELGRRYPYMDLDRVGIFGTSGGGYATVHAMEMFPDFFKAGVADAGNHDQRSYIAVWGETYNGPESGSNYTDAANPTLAGKIKGKLFLLHGDMDSNVLPSQTLQLADALIRANKDFDLLIIPNEGHGALMSNRYALRRSWDFFVRTLLHAEPPPNYDLSAPGAVTGAH